VHPAAAGLAGCRRCDGGDSLLGELRTDDPHEALADLIEVLALEPAELSYVQEGVSLEQALALEDF